MNDFQKWLREKGLDENNLSEEQRNSLIGEFEATRPYPNFHSCRLEDPNKYPKKTYGKCAEKHSGKCIDVVYGIISPKHSEIQALRYSNDIWTASDARSHCSSRGGSFEAATGKEKQDDLIEQHSGYPNDLTVRNYQVRFDTIRETETERSVEAVLATEERVLVLDLSRWAVVEEILLMNGCKKADQIPLLDSHNRSSLQNQLGSIRDFRTEDGKLIGRKYFSKSTMADHAWILTREGHARDNSIGYRVTNPLTIEVGKEQEINGKKYKASEKYPLRIVTEWELKEASVVPIGADKSAINRSIAESEYRENVISIRSQTMEEFRKWLTARGLDYDQLDEAKRTTLKAEFKAEQKTMKAADTSQVDKDNVDVKKIVEDAARDATRTERERVSAIRKLAGSDIPADKVEECIREGKTVEESQGIFLGALRLTRPMVGSLPSIHSHGDELSKESLVDSMLLRAGYEDMFQSDKKRGDERATAARKFRDISMLDICRYAIFLEGQNIPISREDVIRAAFSMATLPQLLGNVVNKALMKGYAFAPESWRRWCNIGNLPDYKNKQVIRLTDMGSIPQIPDGGEVKYGLLAEEYEQYRIYDYGQNIGVTNQTIINDDLQAITKVPAQRGLAIKQALGDLVYAHLIANGLMTDGTALFYATTHLNLITSNALARNALDKALYTFKKQVDKDGKPLNIPPTILLVPPELFITATELVRSAMLIVTQPITPAAAPPLLQGNYNALSETGLQVVDDARLSGLTNGSTTTWYLMADPNMTDNIEVGFLQGQQEPKVETFNPGPDRLGIIYRITHAFGCKAIDWRGMQKNTA